MLIMQGSSRSGWSLALSCMVVSARRHQTMVGWGKQAIV